ncbi:hypothetical protein IE81DRAFT_74481 [Ceraceosorus guamensis]|uniref:Uncharacterized protein n=1 Tax=Ceraceosorus guamensis TaxID=1522189 RepID=A0A316VMN3_9BASI|nr:hypothetical protein IE81DRAFT_74481 [Ceraceosorus guamensis]PWN38807.1 hypothetical protein IE81DRAFT_74481 [Ceraceosorus guamensis]
MRTHADGTMRPGHGMHISDLPASSQHPPSMHISDLPASSQHPPKRDRQEWRVQEIPLASMSTDHETSRAERTSSRPHKQSSSTFGRLQRVVYAGNVGRDRVRGKHAQRNTLASFVAI